MSVTKAQQTIEELKAAPELEEGDLPKAWTNAWYKAGFRHGLVAALESLRGLASDRHYPKKPQDWQTVYKLLMEHRFELMERMISNDRDHPGILRYNHQDKRYEWYHPMSEAEGYEVLKMLWEMRQNELRSKD